MADTTVEQTATTGKAQPQRDWHPWAVYAICLGTALLFMFFFGLNSPLHTFNSYCDYQWYMTMGHGINAGKVPYRVYLTTTGRWFTRCSRSQTI